MADARLLFLQRQELTQYHICQRLLPHTRDPRNQALLARMATDEQRHYQIWRARTGQDVQPDWRQVHAYVWISRLLGLTFGLRLLEDQEEAVERQYEALVTEYPEAAEILAEEAEHEQALIARIQEQRLEYISSVVLGVSDALVELTGALAGFTLALQNTRLIAAVGLITGIAAAMSMGASEYLSVKSEPNEAHKAPLTAAFYTSGAYLLTVLLLVLPYLLGLPLYVALGCSLTAAVGIIAAFTSYQSVVFRTPFGPRFREMAGLTLAVAVFSFGLGWAVREAFGVEV